MTTNKIRKLPTKAVTVDSQAIRDRCDHADPWLMDLRRINDSDGKFTTSKDFKAVIVCRNCGERLEGIVRAR